MTPKSQFPACDVALDAGAQLVSTNGALMLLVNIVGPFYPSIILRQGDKAQKLTLQLLEESQGVMTEETHTGLQRQYDRPVLSFTLSHVRKNAHSSTLSQLSRSDGMWKKKGKTAMQFARFRLAKKAKPGKQSSDYCS
ncbi:hypothetical protein FOMPIDRAFT_1013998 [Fomitopsis schrenkii]|uniref:Uncharacterized protein n=1 Tax=Fomitopsis schrenkii TaxID=2126942 RepID=S8FU40_FOMSC|nr:hypothetical protein FOMPIDRAFT_1013998 [Fomitopsis schrenkii]